jgi:hypothetical protein
MHPVQARKNTPDINRAKATINKSDDPEGLRRPRLRDREREREREREIERERERERETAFLVTRKNNSVGSLCRRGDWPRARRRNKNDGER